MRKLGDRKKDIAKVRRLLRSLPHRTPPSVGSPTFRHSKTHVFVNIPYDRPYTRLAEALFATLAAYGFYPVLARSSRRETVRLSKIIGLIKNCKYGISDLTRPLRHNMPLEHGMMIVIQSTKCCAICKDRFAVLRRMSDSGGFDPIEHKNRPSVLVHKLTKWLKDNAAADIRADLADIDPDSIVRALPLIHSFLKQGKGIESLREHITEFLYQAAYAARRPRK